MVATPEILTELTKDLIDTDTQLITDTDPWVADLRGGTGDSDCQSMVGFDNHPCDDTADYYVELETPGYAVDNPRWEGKVCRSCLAGWVEWEREEPTNVRVISVNPIIAGN